MATGGLYGWPQAPLQRTVWTFLYPFPSSSLTNHTSRMHNTVHLCLDLTPHIYLGATPFPFFLHACAEVHQSHNVLINCSARCALQKYTRARKFNCRHSQWWDTGCWHRDQICSMHALEIRVSTSSFLIFNSNRNPSFFFKDAWDILSHGDKERRQRKCFCGRESEGKRRHQLQMKVQLQEAVKQSKEAQWLGTVRARWGLHLLNESRQCRGVPWPTGGLRSAQHCRRLHHYRGFQGMWCWCGGRHLPRSRGPWWVCGKHCRNLLIQFGRKVFWTIQFSSCDRMVTECWCGYMNISA